MCPSFTSVEHYYCSKISRTPEIFEFDDGVAVFFSAKNKSWDHFIQVVQQTDAHRMKVDQAYSNKSVTADLSASTHHHTKP
jgi:hypothetical protein